jgi:hypothetical protein
LLLVGWWVKPAAIWSAALFALYAALMVRAGSTGAEHGCGCFQEHDIPAGYTHALVNFVLLLGALWLFRHPDTWLVWRKTVSLRAKI